MSKSKLPAQIQKQADDVQELYRQMNDDGTPPEGDGAGTGEGTPPADDTNNGAPPAAQVVDRESYDLLKHQYSTLQGMFSALEKRSREEAASLKETVTKLEALLSTVQSNGQPPKPTAPAKRVTDRDVEEFGDSIDVMRRAALDELDPVTQRLAQLEKQVGQVQSVVVPRVEQVARHQAQTAEEGFWDALYEAVPNWEAINDDAKFQGWLLAIDPLTGIQRQVYLEDAQRKLDAGRVVAFFQSWEALTGAGQNPPPNTQETRKAELEQQVAPGKARNAPPVSSAKKQYSGDDIANFFNDVRAGKYKGREGERANIEADIFAATREGRITT